MSQHKVTQKFALPVVGEWYIRRDSGEMVEVVYVDHDAQVIDLHDQSGRQFEMRVAEWQVVGMKSVPAPSDVYETSTIILDGLEIAPAA